MGRNGTIEEKTQMAINTIKEVIKVYLNDNQEE